MIRMLSLLSMLPVYCTAQTIIYQWPGVNGSVDLFPRNSDASFMGSATSWTGVVALVDPFLGKAHPQLAGWSKEPGDSYLMVNVLAFDGFVVDSLIIQHRHGIKPIDRLRVLLSVGPTARERIACDTTVSAVATSLSIPIKGFIQPLDGNEYGYLQIKVQAYGNAEGTWEPLLLRIVATHPARDSALTKTPMSEVISHWPPADLRTVKAGRR